ncbi:hypothetical protein K1X76_06545 [bacterium]|nr:hypothetical protein [bacterium]
MHKDTQIEKLYNFLKKNHASKWDLAAHEYHKSAFGSFIVVFQCNNELVKFMCDRKDFIIDIKKSTVLKLPYKWEDVNCIQLTDKDEPFDTIQSVLDTLSSPGARHA